MPDDTSPDAITLQALLDTVRADAAARVADITQRLGRTLGGGRRQRRGFEARLRNPWGEALDLLGLLVEEARNRGAAFDRAHREQAARDQDYRFDALVRLHARACLIASEIHALLGSGYASGAMARWRALYEMTVVAFVLAENPPALAERYLLHGHIAAHRALLSFQEHAARLGYDPESPEAVAESRRILDELVARFGSPYANDYGWASGVGWNPAPHVRPDRGQGRVGALAPLLPAGLDFHAFRPCEWLRSA